MRHLTSVILGPVLGIVAYVLFGFGVGRTSVEEGWTGDNALGVLAIVGAGVAYAILVVPRLSPIGPALVGIGYLGIGLWIISDVSSFIDTMPSEIVGIDNAGFGAGTLLVALAIPLLATLVSPDRWMGRAPRTAPAGQFGGQPAAGQFGSQPPPGQFGGQPAQGQFGGQPTAGQFGGQPEPPQFGGQPEPPPFGGQPSYPGTPPIGAPYSGPPSFGPPPGSPVAPSGYDPYGTPPPSSGGPTDPLRPDVTRRIQ